MSGKMSQETIRNEITQWQSVELSSDFLNASAGKTGKHLRFCGIGE